MPSSAAIAWHASIAASAGLAIYLLPSDVVACVFIALAQGWCGGYSARNPDRGR